MRHIDRIEISDVEPRSKDIGWLCPSESGNLFVFLVWNVKLHDWVPITIPFSKEELKEIIDKLFKDGEIEFPQEFYDMIENLINEYLKNNQLYEPGTGISFSEPNPETGKITISATFEGVLHLLGVHKGTPQDLPEASLDNYGGVYVIPMYDSESDTNIFQEYACTRTETTTTDPDTGEETTEYSYQWELLGAVNDFSGWAENVGFAYTGNVDTITSIAGDKEKDGTTYPNVDQVLNKIISKVWFTPPKVTISAHVTTPVEVDSTISSTGIDVTGSGTTDNITSLTLSAATDKTYASYDAFSGDTDMPQTKSMVAASGKNVVATLTGKYIDGDGVEQNLTASEIIVTGAYKWYHGATTSTDYEALLGSGSLLTGSSATIDRPEYGGNTNFVIVTQKTLKKVIDTATNADFLLLDSTTMTTTSITRNGKAVTYNVYTFTSADTMSQNTNGINVTF